MKRNAASGLFTKPLNLQLEFVRFSTEIEGKTIHRIFIVETRSYQYWPSPDVG